MFFCNFRNTFCMLVEMKKWSIFLFSMFCVIWNFAQPDNGNFREAIVWNANQSLVWQDFKATPIDNAPEAAMTASSIEISYHTKGNAISWTVNVKFFPYLSWSKEDKQNDYILKHEQLHFDITELYGRLLRKELTAKIKTAKDVKLIKTIQKKTLQKWQIEQNKYDAETQHSILEDKQLMWNKNIEERLLLTQEFASSK